jgi:hypothetical protein
VKKSEILTTAGGRIVCNRCHATSKRTKQQCKAPAVKGKQVCRFHGGKSTGPITEEGKQRCIDAHTIYGHETRLMRAERKYKLKKLRELEVFMVELGII